MTTPNGGHNPGPAPKTRPRDWQFGDPTPSYSTLGIVSPGPYEAGQLAFIVRDLMAAAGYEYDPERPLADQSRECCDLIRVTASEWRRAVAAWADDSARHKAEEQRLTDLVNEFRKHIDARDRVLRDRNRELAQVKEQLATAQRTWLLAANRAAGRSDTDADGG